MSPFIPDILRDGLTVGLYMPFSPTSRCTWGDLWPRKPVGPSLTFRTVSGTPASIAKPTAPAAPALQHTATSLYLVAATSSLHHSGSTNEHQETCRQSGAARRATVPLQAPLGLRESGRWAMLYQHTEIHVCGHAQTRVRGRSTCLTRMSCCSSRADPYRPDREPEQRRTNASTSPAACRVLAIR